MPKTLSRLLATTLLAGLLLAPLPQVRAQEIPVSPVWEEVQESPPPPPEGSVGLSQAYDDGYWQGVAPPLIGWGSAYTVSGVLVMGLGAASSNSGGYLNLGAFFLLVGGITAALGLGQLIPGLVLIASDEEPYQGHAKRAYNAGYDEGWGVAMTIYGGIFTLSMFLQMLPFLTGEGNINGLISALPTALIAGSHLGFGIDSILTGQESWRDLQRSQGVSFHMPLLTIHW